MQDAIGYDAALGDSVTVTASAPVPAAADWGDGPVEAGPAAAASPGEPVAAQSLFGSLWTLLALMLAIGGAVLLLRRRGRGPGQMSERDRLAYVANLKALLAQRDADVAPPA